LFGKIMALDFDTIWFFSVLFFKIYFKIAFMLMIHLGWIQRLKELDTALLNRLQ